MKRLIIHLMTISILLLSLSYVANAATCDLGTEGWINGTWTVPADCTFPTGPHLINGDAIVGNTIVTIPTDSMIVMSLSTNKITFALGKILLSGTAAIKRVRAQWHGASGSTLCPNGSSAINPTSLANAPAALTANNASADGILYCQ